MISNRQAQLPEHWHRHTDLQPPHPKTMEKLLSELQDALDRDQHFLMRGEELLARWKTIARRMQERFRQVLGGERIDSA